MWGYQGRRGKKTETEQVTPNQPKASKKGAIDY
jgi:hypothetical protein